MSVRRLSKAAVLGCALVAVTAATPPATGRVDTAAVASTRESMAGKRSYWIVLASDRDGGTRAYSVRQDGSRLTPLVKGRGQFGTAALSGDGRVIAYTTSAYGAGAIYTSHADGTGRHRMSVTGSDPALSRTGRWLAFTRTRGCCVSAIWIVRTDGRGLRRLSFGAHDAQPDWSPTGKAVVFIANDRSIVVQPLGGPRRVIVRGRTTSYGAKWAPNGRWIGYIHYQGALDRRNGLYLVRADGTHRHLAVRDATSFAWSPNGRNIATTDSGNNVPPRVAVVGVHGVTRKRLRLAVAPTQVIWSPGGRRLILAADGQVWTVRRDGHGLRRLTSAGHNSVIGWTRIAPAFGPAPRLAQTERVLDAETLATRAPITDLSADGPGVAFIPEATGIDCNHLAVWRPSARSIRRFSLPAPCEYGSAYLYGLELAGSRAAWVSAEGGNTWENTLETATLQRVAPMDLAYADTDADEEWEFHLAGDGHLLVFNDGSRLVRIGLGRERCTSRNTSTARVCSTLRRGVHAAPADSVSGSLVAIREPGEVAVLDAAGRIVRLFPFAPRDVSAARLDGARLVVVRPAVLEAYDVTSGRLLLSRPLPSGYRLTDAAGGLVLLRRANSIVLTRLVDGHTFTLTPRRGPVLAELEPSGLYYSYVTARRRGRLVLVPRAKLLQRLALTR